MSSLKATNKKRKATATDVMNRAAEQAAWSALGLRPVPSAHIKRGHSNGKMRGVGANKSIIRDSCMKGSLVDVAKCRKEQLFFGSLIEEKLKKDPKLRLYRCPKCHMGPYTYAGRASHRFRCNATDQALAKAIKNKTPRAGREMEERRHAIRRNHTKSTTTDRSGKRAKTTSASAPGFNTSTGISKNSIVTSNDDMDLDGDAEYAEASKPVIAYDEMFKAAAIKIAKKVDGAYKGRKQSTHTCLPNDYARNPMIVPPHWARNIREASRFVGPAFVYVWAPDLWWNQDAIPKSMRLRPGVNDEREAQFLVCPHKCGGHLISKENWVARKVMSFGEDGAIVSKQMICNTCKKRVMPWDPQVLNTLPQHVQDDFPIVM